MKLCCKLKQLDPCVFSDNEWYHRCREYIISSEGCNPVVIIIAYGLLKLKPTTQVQNITYVNITALRFLLNNSDVCLRDLVYVSLQLVIPVLPCLYTNRHVYIYFRHTKLCWILFLILLAENVQWYSF